jgi:hypothetical protein
MASFDIKTKKISNCKELSMAWWHEKGHQLLHENDTWNDIEAIGQHLYLLVVALLIAKLNTLAGFFFLIYLAILMFDECMAWIYCLQNKKRWAKY